MVDFIQQLIALFQDNPATMTIYGISCALFGGIVTNYIQKKSIVSILQIVFGIMLVFDQLNLFGFEMDFIVKFTVVFGMIGAQFEKWHQQGLFDEAGFAKTIVSVINSLTSNNTKK